MVKYKHRRISFANYMGYSIKFIEENDRIKDRVENLSYESDVLRTLIKCSDTDDIVWDVGACLGIHTFVTAAHTSKKVISFEPMPSNRAALVDNMHVNDFQNVHVMKEALDKKEREKDFSIRTSEEPGYGRHGFSTGDYEDILKIKVPTVSGDDLVKNKGFEIPNVVKIDVEGASPLVLQGMKSVLEHDECTDVILETHEPNPVQPSHEDFGFTREDIIEFLEERGFTVKTLNNEFHLHATKNEHYSQEDFNSKTTINGTRVKIIQDDIAQQDTDVIVNSAGTSLRMGSGVAGALREKAGEEINLEAIRKGPLDVGEIAVTDSYDLNCDKVIHAASMPHYENGKSTVESIRQSARKAIRKADEIGAKSISIPAIGCGVAGVSITNGFPAIFNEIKDYEFENVEEIRLVTYSNEEYQITTEVLDL